MDKVVVITGPTATGKTALGIMLAKQLGGEIVSADSMQIYRHMDIGTAKPGAEERQGIPHHMLDIVMPHEEYSVARYVENAAPIVDDIVSRGKIPIIVGGTGLYVESLIAGRLFAPEDKERLREELSEEYDRLGGKHMLSELRKVDPGSAASLHPNDKKRVVRAIEIYRLTGHTATEYNEESK
ncbi:MAG: tRNA (adenosine(37)-N6)-dimethylallyltransferase MiaA, partial [Clostridiales bacterium]|nr:tRNA (adenosine(37)-N6)-dimethylallyltransferase MiaA [Clostridiales bacterium]